MRPTNASIVVGDTKQLTAVVLPENAPNKLLKWGSSDVKIATVNDKGVVTAVAVGTATITATTKDGGRKATCTVTVTATAVKVSGVQMDKLTTTILVGATETLSATIAPAEATNHDLTWSSDKKEIATVVDGVVTAVAVGTATITATTEDGGHKATCTVTVAPIAVTGVSLDKTTANLEVGKELTLVPKVLPANATNKQLKWGSSDEAIATVNDKGVVTAVALGKATITATTEDDSKTATCTVTVAPVAVTGVSLDKTTEELEVGKELTLVATVLPADAPNKTVTWTSSDEAVATVVDGVVTAVAVGTATITATTEDGSKTATCTVTVAPVAVTGVSLDKTTEELDEGGTFTLTPTVLPAEATDKTVTWVSSDEAVATVDANGEVKAVKAGTATITATSVSNSAVSGGCVITVKGRSVNSPTADQYVEIGGLKWAKGNLVAKNDKECKVGVQTDYGVYFHFGSLVGWSGGANGDGTGKGQPALAIKVKPAAYLGSATWPAGYYKENSTDTKECILPATDAPITGIGDPCRYYLGGAWRTPTATEYKALIEAGKGDYLLTPVYGRWFGRNPGTESSSVFFPVPGNRELTAGKLTSDVGSYGYFWSSSASNTGYGYHMQFQNGSEGYAVLPHSSGKARLVGMPVRCVSLK